MCESCSLHPKKENTTERIIPSSKMDEYKITEHIGDGAHGHVLKGYSLKTARTVALKRIHFKKNEDEIPVSVLREIKILLTVECTYVSDYSLYNYLSLIRLESCWMSFV